MNQVSQSYTVNKSINMLRRAKNVIPGGVNSPVRAFKSVKGDPLFIKKAKGPYIYDEDGNEYIELINSWGPMILGHAHPIIVEAVQKAAESSLSFGAPTEKEIELAELIIKMVPSIEKVRMVNSGTEATMSAIRVARGYTGKDKIIKFSGCYHGHGDSFLIDAGSGVATLGIPGSPGVTKGTAADTLSAPFNDAQEVENLLIKNGGEVAAVIIEPVPGNMGLVHPTAGFLEQLRTLCDQHHVILIFDEVMTGFRLAKGGAQERLGVIPDMTCLGKVIGGGMPVGAYGGKKEIMDYVAPDGPVYQAGTLSGNPIAMAAGIATIGYLDEHPESYQRLDEIGTKLKAGTESILKELDLSYNVAQLGSMFTLFFRNKPVHNFEDAKHAYLDLFADYFKQMLQHGIYLAPSQFESLFLGLALEDHHIDRILEATRASLKAIKG